MTLYDNYVNWSVFDGEITLAKDAREHLRATLFSTDSSNRNIQLLIDGQSYTANLMNVPSSNSVQISYGKTVQDTFQLIFGYSFDFYATQRAEAKRQQMSTRKLPSQNIERISIEETNAPLVFLVHHSSCYTSELPYSTDQRNAEEELLFPEGRRVYRNHIARERNHGVISLAKTLFMEKHGTLFCEVCSFSFSVYGERGMNFIEAHHDAIPVSEMGENAASSIHDIRMVCSNCHRILHLKRPWLKVNELRKLLNPE